MALHASELGGAAPILLTIHIAAGALSVLAGATALSARKGEGLHRAAGNLFFASMLIMSATAAYIAVLIQNVTVFGAILTFYLVATAWATVRRKEGSIGLFERGAFFFAVGVGAVELICGLVAANAPDGRFLSYPPGPYFVVAAVAALAAAFDLKVILQGGIYGAPRVARHLWRMCFALFTALVSFIGQGLRHILPASTPGFAYLLLPALVPLILMIYWLIRVRLTNWYKSGVGPAR